MFRLVRAVRTAAGRLTEVSRYDLVLAVIPAAFVLAATLRTAVSLSSTTAVAAAAGLSALAVIDALFLNPPRGPREAVGSR